MLKVPISLKDPPQAIRVDIAWVGPVGTTFRLLTNGQEILTRSIPGEPYPAPRRSFVVPLKGVVLKPQMEIVLASDTFIPAETLEGSRDRRELGVAIEGVWLLRESGDTED
jgi:hypothetical protein